MSDERRGEEVSDGARALEDERDEKRVDDAAVAMIL